MSRGCGRRNRYIAITFYFVISYFIISYCVQFYSVVLRSFTTIETNKFGQAGAQKAARRAIIESQATAVAADPEAVVAIDQQAADEVIRKRGRVLRVVAVASKGRCSRVKARETAADCPSPDEALAVAGQAEDAVTADGGGVGWVVAIIFDAETVLVENIEPGAIGSNVEEAGGSFIKAADLGMGQAGRVERVGQETHEILAVEIELADAAVGTDPQDALGSEVERDDAIVGQGEGIMGQVAVRDKDTARRDKLAETAGVGADPDGKRGGIR